MITNLTEYYLRWYHERPVGITTGRREELRELHRIIYKCSLHLALNYKDYVPKWMPLGEKDLEILELQEQTPFRAGTWRPDYIIGTDGSLRICEITSRFFAHGIFISRFAEEAADRFMARFPGAVRDTEYPVLMESLKEGKRYLFLRVPTKPVRSVSTRTSTRGLGARSTYWRPPKSSLGGKNGPPTGQLCSAP